MAITATVLTSGAGNGFGTQSYNTASITPGSNKLILLAVSISTFAVSAGALSATGNGLTYVAIDSQLYSGTTNRIALFRAMGASPSSGAITISIGGATNNSCQWAVIELDGVDTSGTNGSGAIVQGVFNSTTGGAPNSLTITLAALSDAVNNAVVSVFGVSGDTLQTPAASYTELSDNDSLTGSEANSLETQWKLPGTTTPSASGQPDFADIGGIAVEIKAGGGGGGGATTPQRLLLLGVGM